MCILLIIGLNLFLDFQKGEFSSKIFVWFMNLDEYLNAFLKKWQFMFKAFKGEAGKQKNQRVCIILNSKFYKKFLPLACTQVAHIEPAQINHTMLNTHKLNLRSCVHGTSFFCLSRSVLRFRIRCNLIPCVLPYTQLLRTPQSIFMK